MISKHWKCFASKSTAAFRPRHPDEASPRAKVLLGRCPLYAVASIWISYVYSSLSKLTQAPSEFWEDVSLQSEKAMAPYSSTLAWKIPWMEEPGGLQSMGSLRVGHD